MEKLFINRSISVVHVASCNRIRTCRTRLDLATPFRVEPRKRVFLNFRANRERGRIDPRRRPFKRCSRWCTRLFVRVVWSFHQTDQRGATTTGHDDDFDSQTHTPITPELRPAIRGLGVRLA